MKHLKKKIDGISVKQSKIITQQPKTFESPNIIDTKSVIIKHPKTRKAEKVFQVGSDSSLYSDT